MLLTKTQATMTYESKATETQVYNLKATAQYVVEGKLNSISGGEVRTEQKMVASFNRYNEEDLNVNFTNVTPEEQVDILASINEFVASIEKDINK